MAAIKTLFTLILISLTKLKQQPGGLHQHAAPEGSTSGKPPNDKTDGAPPPTAASGAAAAAAAAA